MAIQVGDTIPKAVLNTLRDGVQAIGTDEIFRGRKVVLFAVPGAFTPTCSARHLPGFVDKLAEFRARGIDVACLAVNDAFVMDAWAKSQSVPDDIRMLALHAADGIEGVITGRALYDGRLDLAAAIAMAGRA